jgi:excinuclease ABC subunit B
MTGSMQRAIDETDRRRTIQRAYNVEHNITPVGVTKSIDEVRFITRVADARDEREAREGERMSRGKEKKVAEAAAHYGTDDLPGLIARLEQEMRDAAKNLDFEAAARLRDQLFDIRAKMDGTRGAPRSKRAQR